MAYSIEQKRTIRAALSRYRIKNRTRDAFPLAVAGVLRAMKRCEDVPASFFDEVRTADPKNTMKVLDGRLTRFINGKDSGDETIDALKSFLLAEGDLTEEALGDPEYAEMLAVYNHLASQTNEARQRTAALAGLTFLQPGKSEGPTISLKFEFDSREKKFLRIEELTFWPQRLKRGSSQISRNSQGSLRTGFGFFATQSALLHLFLVGNSASDRVHYIELNALSKSGLGINLIRAGGSPKSLRVLPEEIANARDIDLHHFEGEERTIESDRHPLHMLHDAVKGGDRDDVQAASLIFFNRNGVDENGMNALHHAAALGNRDVVMFLLKWSPINTGVKDNFGRDAAELALRWGGDAALSRLLTLKTLGRSLRASTP